jgi:hypothetical protein
LTITTNDNLSGDVLTATITITSELGVETIEITKRGNNAELTVDPTGEFTLTGMQRTIEVDIQSNLTWTAVSNQPTWATISTGSGVGDGTLTITIPQNNAQAPRDATITISGGGLEPHVITIKQWHIGRISDSLALVAFYNSTNGQNSTLGWNFETPITTWASILLRDENEDLPEDATGELRVREMNIWDRSLSGSIPPEIGTLTELTQFHAGGSNFIEGTLPEELGYLTNLQLFGIGGNNRIGGPLPYGLGNLPKLHTLWVDNNNFTGSIPPSWANLFDFDPPPSGFRIAVFGNRLTGVAEEVMANRKVWDLIWQAGLCAQQAGYKPHEDCP